MTQSIFQAQSFELPFDPRTTVLVMIGMQRGFVEAGGFGEALGGDASSVRTAIAPHTEVLAAARQKGIVVIHTREGHRTDLDDCPPTKLTRDRKTFIGEPEPVGHILVRGEAGYDTIPELYLMAGGPVIDKPGKDTFYQTDSYLTLRNHGTKTLTVCSITTEVCITTTAREANGRDYKRIIPEGCVGPYSPESQGYALEMIKVQGAILGWVADPRATVAGLEG